MERLRDLYWDVVQLRNWMVVKVLNKRLKPNPAWEWQGLRYELWLLWHLEGWFWYNVSAARFLASNWYILRNHERWCKMLDRHVCAYMPGCRTRVSADRKAMEQVRKMRVDGTLPVIRRPD